MCCFCCQCFVVAGRITGWILFLLPNQQDQTTEDVTVYVTFTADGDSRLCGVDSCDNIGRNALVDACIRRFHI